MIDEKRIQENLQLFSFPRIFGTADEKKAYHLAKDKIGLLKINVNSQEFNFSNFYSIVYPKIVFTIIFTIILLYFINFKGYIQDLIVLILITVLILVVILSKRFNSFRLGKKFNSQNIYAKFDSNKMESQLFDNKKNVILIAHLDSKGQRIHIVNRVKNFILWTISFILLVVIIILKNVIFTQYAPLFYILGVLPLALNFFSCVVIVFNNTNNDSDGALDDASGIVCILELLNYYSNCNQERSLKNMDLWFVLTGAEECGTQGIRNFYKIIKGNINRNQTIVLNFDSIGKNLDFVKFGIFMHKKKILTVFKRQSEKYSLKTDTRRVLFGVHTDGYFLAKRGYQGIEFGDYDSYKYLHSSKDTIDKIDPLLLKKLCEIVIDSMSEIDNLK